MRLVPCGDWDVCGESPDPAAWRYKGNVYGPDGGKTVQRGAASVLHFRYSFDASRPWQGVGPLARAGLSADLLSALETRLGQEASAPSAYVVPSPIDGQATTTGSLRSDLKSAKGGVVLAETWRPGTRRRRCSTSGLGQKRIGAHPPDVAAALRTEAGRGCGGLRRPSAVERRRRDRHSGRRAAVRAWRGIRYRGSWRATAAKLDTEAAFDWQPVRFGRGGTRERLRALCRAAWT